MVWLPSEIDRIRAILGQYSPDGVRSYAFGGGGAFETGARRLSSEGGVSTHISPCPVRKSLDGFRSAAPLCICPSLSGCGADTMIWDRSVDDRAVFASRSVSIDYDT